MQKRHHDPTPETKKGLSETLKTLEMIWSGRQDLNLRPLVPQTSALPDCATPRTKQGGIYHFYFRVSSNLDDYNFFFDL